MTAPMRDEPLCHEADAPTTPCRFWQQCHPSRRRLQHYAGLRGDACWAFQMLTARLGSEAQQERAAIQAEGTA
jgi:hypothetical protein